MTAVEVGTELPSQTVRIDRATLVRYAGASGDFNPIHWSDRVAREVGLEGVIAHGMLTMGAAARLVTEWAGDPERVEEYSTRFTNPIAVPDSDEPVELVVTGKVAAVLDDGRVRVDLTATVGETKVLGMARAVVRVA